MKYQHNRTKVYLVNYHLIGCPKRRKTVLIGKIKERLEQIIKEVAEEKGIDILALAVNPNHIHLFVSAFPVISAHKIVKAFKGRSSKFLRQEFPELLKLPPSGQEATSFQPLEGSYLK